MIPSRACVFLKRICPVDGNSVDINSLGRNIVAVTSFLYDISQYSKSLIFTDCYPCKVYNRSQTWTHICSFSHFIVDNVSELVY